MLPFLKSLFGDKQARELKKFWPLVDEINAVYETLAPLSDDDLRARTAAFRQRIGDAVKEIEADQATLRARLKGTDPQGDGEPPAHLTPDERTETLRQLDELDAEWLDTLEGVLDEILPEAFAVVKETCRRLVGHEYSAGGKTVVWDMVPYDVQLLGGIALHQGKIAEMKTGEGKTLVAVAPLYLNALAGRGVHVVTVNPYLAQRDSEWMAPVFEFHGLTVDVIDRHTPNSPERRQAYLADITYGTNNEFGFDYLRDNSFVFEAEQLSQRGHHFAVVDEVDSVLVDEARTPLIISGPVPQANDAAFGELKPAIEKLVFQQQKLVAAFGSEVERKIAERDRLLTEGKKREAARAEDDAGLALLRMHRGFPRNKKLAKLLQEPGMGTLLQKTEFYYLQDNAKNMPEADAPLLFALDEKNHSIELTEQGVDTAAGATGDERALFVLPDLGAAIADLEQKRTAAIAAGTPEEEAVQTFENERRELYARYAAQAERLHAIEQLLRAYTLYEKDVEYIVQEGKVMIVDEHTGRVLPGRRYSDGLHQAIEAKENVEVQAATQTYATITLQNYFRLYHKLAGMTGTAETEAEEFYKIYKLDVVVVPTNRPIQRHDHEDIIYRTKREKYRAVLDRIKQYHIKGQPVLVGTTSVDASETISRMLQREGIPHNVLNAKRDRAKQEADIVAEAGQRGAVTIATNMAGRGTDIKLGQGVTELGGLAILGTERHESRRIDLQLRGRSGRQGDPGESVFYVSFEDDLMRLFGERAAKVFDTFKLEEGTELVHPWATKSIERAQKKVEQNNFAMRKRQLEYDDVLNAQRTVIYDRRMNALTGERTRADVDEAMQNVFRELAEKYGDEAQADDLRDELRRAYAFDVEISKDEMSRLSTDALADRLYDEAIKVYEAKRDALARPFGQGLAGIAAQPEDQRPYKLFVDFTDGKRYLRVTTKLADALATHGDEINDALERAAVLAVIDEKWTEHLRDLDEIKEGIHLRAYGQKDPLIEYKMEAFRTFEEMIHDIDREVVGILFKAGPLVADEGAQRAAPRRPQPRPRLDASRARAEHEAVPTAGGDDGGSVTRKAGSAAAPAHAPQQPYVAGERHGRNDVVTIQNPATGATQTLKFKHAEARLRQGWILVS
jgi:preprotein translocase subunit SecA